jgi:hypothetical protein
VAGGAHRRRRTALPSIPFRVNLIGARGTAVFGVATTLTPRGRVERLRGTGRTKRAAVTAPRGKYAADVSECFAGRMGLGAAAGAAAFLKFIRRRAPAADCTATAAGPAAGPAAV